MKNFFRRFRVIKKIANFLRNDKLYVKKRNNCLIRINSKVIGGKNNTIYIGDNVLFQDISIRIVGSNNTIIIDDNCSIGHNCSFWIDGDNHKIEIGKNTTFNSFVHINAQECNTSIIIGNDCMFANNIIIRTSDSHSIYDINTNLRINYAKDVIIGNHVWIAPNSKIFKGVVISDGSIIGSDTLVTKNIPSNVLAVGHPAKIVKENIRWERKM